MRNPAEARLLGTEHRRVRSLLEAHDAIREMQNGA
jgi:hypothetical protein